MNGSFDVMLGCLNLATFIFAVVSYSLSQKRVFAESDEWQNKYKKPIERAPKNWYYRLTGVRYKEKFPLSATLLVAFTDRYHAYQTVFKAFLCLSISFYQPIFSYYDALIYFALFGVVFSVVFRLGK